MSEAQSASDTESLGHELLQVQSHTMGDGRAYGKIVEISNYDGILKMRIEVLTTGDRFLKTFEKPTTWDTTNELVRLIDWSGYSAASAEQLEGEEVPVINNDDEWLLDFERIKGSEYIKNGDYIRGVGRGFTVATLISMAYLFIWPGVDAISVLISTYIPIAAPFSGYLAVGLGGVGLLIALLAGNRWVMTPIEDADPRRSTSIFEYYGDGVPQDDLTGRHGEEMGDE